MSIWIFKYPARGVLCCNSFITGFFLSVWKPVVLEQAIRLCPLLHSSFGALSSRLFCSSKIVVCLESRSFFLHSPRCPGTHYVDQAGLELKEIYLPLPPQALGLKAESSLICHCYGPVLFLEIKIISIRRKVLSRLGGKR